MDIVDEVDFVDAGFDEILPVPFYDLDFLFWELFFVENCQGWFIVFI